MKVIKKILKKYFESLAYFYSYIRYRLFIVFFLSVFIGVLDALGLTMFMPLLKIADGSNANNADGLGKLSFIVEFINSLGLELTLVTVLGFMAFFFFMKGLVKYIGGVYKIDVLQWLIKKIRYKHINGLTKLSYKYFVFSDVGRLQNTITGEVARVAQAYRNYFESMQALILVISYMIFAFFIDFQFALLVSIGGILTNYLFKTLYRKTKDESRRLTGENSILQGLIIQSVANFKYLKSTGSLKKYGRKLKKSISSIEKTNRTIGRLDAIMNSAREPILVTVVVAIILIQTKLFEAEIGPILISLIFFYRALTYLMQMQLKYNKFLAVSGSLENTQLFEKEMKSNREPNKQGNEFKEYFRKLELKEIDFSYQNNKVLKELSLEINQNETVAFVGESGSGKTTLINIIAGLLPVDNGKYLVNDKDLKEIDTEVFQKKIGYITQDPVIFNDTIFNNITFWKEKTPKNQKLLESSLKQAAILDYVESLPDKEETVLGNNGINLSGGQKQRISIARELFKEAEILILDEATSALDSETEKAIQRNIDNLKGNYTILIVAHRISTIKNADRIVVMKNGKILDIGDFEDLLGKSLYFKRLVELQEV